MIFLAETQSDQAFKQIVETSYNCNSICSMLTIFLKRGNLDFYDWVRKQLIDYFTVTER